VNQYVSKDADRASAFGAEDKRRFTTMIAAPASLGPGIKPPPTFNILGCHVKQAAPSAPPLNKVDDDSDDELQPKKRGRTVKDIGDLTGSSYLRTLHNERGFRVADGWKLLVWEKSIPWTVKQSAKAKKSETEPVTILVNHKRPYLIHTVHGTVVTVQPKAWMDHVGLRMYADLVLRPWAKDDNLLVIWDNCPSHTMDGVKEYYRQLNIEVALLPPNMTDKLQPLDLVVNGPLKADMRKARCEQLYDYFQSFKRESDNLEKDKPKKRFLPPLLKIPDAPELVMTSTKKLFEAEESQKSISKCFIKVGLAPDPNLHGEFRKYTGLKEVSKPDDGTTTDKLLEMTVIGEEPDEEETTGEDCLDDDPIPDEFGQYGL
jgi:hypothetical protein